MIALTENRPSEEHTSLRRPPTADVAPIPPLEQARRSKKLIILAAKATSRMTHRYRFAGVAFADVMAVVSRAASMAALAVFKLVLLI
jgi:hypothetical protein